MTSTLAISNHSPRACARPGAVLLVGPLPPPSGGMANQTRQLAALLAGEGCAVEVVATNEAYRPRWIGRVKGVRALFRLVRFGIRMGLASRDADIAHVMANSGWAWHLMAAPAVWIASLRGLPVVVNYRGGEAERFFASQFRFVQPTLRRAQLVVVPSGFLHEVFARYGVPTTVVPNIVNLEAFTPAPARPEIPHVLVTRNLEAIYDVATALRAFALLASAIEGARMTVAGSGPERSALERLAGELGIAPRVRFTGRLDNAELPSLYREATIALNPSRADNMPISLLEALASAVPIVSTDVGGVPHLVHNGVSALLVPPGDAAAMADALQKLARDRALGDRLAAEGLRLAANYAWPRVRDELFLAYQAARERRGSAALPASGLRGGS